MHKPRLKWLLESIALAGLLVGVAFLAVMGEPKNPDIGTSAILVAGFGLPWLILKTGLVKSAVVPTPLLLSAWSLHFVLLSAIFYWAQVRFDRWKDRRQHASA